MEAVVSPPSTVHRPPSTGETPDGFFWCGHCNHAMDLAADADPAGTFKCSRCHKWTVRWKFPSPARAPRPKMQAPPALAVAPCSEQAASLFSSLKNAVS